MIQKLYFAASMSLLCFDGPIWAVLLIAANFANAARVAVNYYKAKST
jgi:hypothetical protein